MASSTHVQPEEAQAILDAVQPPRGKSRPQGEVAARDFAKPLRLSGRGLDDVRKRVAAVLEGCAKELSRALRGTHTLTLSELREVSADGLFDSAAPCALLRFDVAGHPGWVRWDGAGAAAAVEVALGAPQPTLGERALSAVERRIAGQMLDALLVRIAAALELKVAHARMVATLDDAGSWRDAGPRADRARMRVHLDFEGPGGTSGIDLYLPGVSARDDESAAPPVELPEHLGPVTVDLFARLGACDVPLAELLRLEVGDVIPLDAPEGGSLKVLIEEVPCASARWGTHQGQLAIQILTVGRSDDDS